ncbi:MAG: caspase family protein [Deltaproteobacteria bacterium]|nr:caspase family protein [Deltaproteobacteria bacterium]
MKRCHAAIIISVFLLGSATGWSQTKNTSVQAQLHEEIHFFALLVGSNLPGARQTPLRYAHDDVEKIKNVLVEIGKYSKEHIIQLIDPEADTLATSLDKLKNQMAQLPKGAQSRFLFYYSGHAKSSALTLGSDSLSLKELRSALTSIPASQKIVILDACQSGGFSRIKGVQPAADFSHNSYALLQTKGTAVLASSSAEELSQESEELKGSIFTHNLVTGMRGAADADENGRVSIFEAYDYAYDQTLLATAETRIGKQHVTLETDLKGTGETVLTWPEASSARVTLPKGMQGTITIYDEKTHTIHGEIHKAKGSAVTLAFPPGAYAVLVAHNGKGQTCPVQLTKDHTTTPKENTCRTVSLKTATAKHDSTSDNSPRSYRFKPFLEVQAGIQFVSKGAFIHRLERVGLQSDEFDSNQRISYLEVSTGLSFNRYISAGLLYSTLDRMEFFGITQLNQQTTEINYTWVAHRFNGQFRLRYPMWHDRVVPHLFVDIGAGVVNDKYSYKSYNYMSGRPRFTSTQRMWGPVLGGGLGVTVRLYRILHLTSQLKYIYAPILKNLYDEKRNDGGWILTAGLQLRY